MKTLLGLFIVLIVLTSTISAQSIQPPQNLHVKEFIYSDIKINNMHFYVPTILWTWSPSPITNAEYELRYSDGRMITWSVQDSFYWQKYKQAFGQHQLDYYLNNNLLDNLFLHSGDTLRVQVRAVVKGVASNWSEVVGFVVPANPNTSQDKFIFCQNYPNPFNSQTTIKYFLPERAEVNLVIYNSLGQKVNEFKTIQTQGYHSYIWNTLHLSSGVYFYLIKVNTKDKITTGKGKMLLVK